MSNQSTNLYERASREKFRFPSPKGELTVEQLWELPLQSKTGAASLDGVAQAVNKELGAVTENSFVSTTTNPAKPVLEAKLELVKHVIATVMAENAVRAKRAELKGQKDKLLEIKARKQDAALEGKTEAEIDAELAALEAQGV